MVAYSFNPRFETAIREGWKTQTIRKGRARHARPGEMLQLFCGMRTAHCRKIVDHTATYVRYYRRNPTTGRREQISLNAAAMAEA